MILREATEDDAMGIAQVHVASWRTAYRDLIPADFLASLSVEKRSNAWRESLRTTRVRVVLADLSSGIAGWVAFGRCRDEDKDATWGEVEGIYLSPEFWRQGIGERLMASARESLSDMGYLHASLWVLAGNSPARAFYRRVGFVPDGFMKASVLGGARLIQMRYCVALRNVSG